VKILLVENHRVFAETVVKQFLSAHHVTVVGSLAAAHEAASFDAALVDFDLDDGKGDAFVGELRAGGFRGRVIAMSSHAEGNAALMRAGADGVCSKLHFSKIGAVLEPRFDSHAIVFGSQTPPQDVVATLLTTDQLVSVVADGAGGTSHGLEAARAVVDAACAITSTSPAFDAAVWKSALEQVAVTLAARDEGRTTAVIVATDGARVVGASVGDSEAWLIGDDRVRVLTEHQSRKPLLGQAGASVTIFDAVVDHATLLIGSDGLFKYATAEVIAACVRKPAPLEAIARDLADAVRLRGGTLPDDVGLVLVRG